MLLSLSLVLSSLVLLLVVFVVVVNVEVGALFYVAVGGVVVVV